MILADFLASYAYPKPCEVLFLKSQFYYIENISSDINNYQNAINQIKRFDNNLSDSLQSEFDKLIDRMVE